MKNIIISNYDDVNNSHYGGGGAIAVHEVAKRLVKYFKVKVITGKSYGLKNDNIDGVNYQRIGIEMNFIPQISQIIYSLCLPFYVKTENYNVWIESFTPPFSTGFLQLFTKKPVIGLVHMLSGSEMRRKFKFPFDVIEKYGLKTYNHIIVNSISIKNKIVGINKHAKVITIGNGIDKIRKHNENSDYALFLGRIDIDQKGLDLLLNSWININKKLIIAGNSDELDNLNQSIEDLGLQEKVTTVDKVSGKEKIELFSNAAFVVIPSRFETYSVVALESFSYGLPVVCFDIAGLEWIPQGAAIKVFPYNTTSFASACNALFKNRKRRNRMGSIGKTYAGKYRWNSIALKYKNYISTLIK